MELAVPEIHPTVSSRTVAGNETRGNKGKLSLLWRRKVN